MRHFGQSHTLKIFLLGVYASSLSFFISLPIAAQQIPDDQVSNNISRNSSVNSGDQVRRKANENIVTIMGSGRLTSYTYFSEDISNVIEETVGDKFRVIAILGKSGGQNVKDVLHLKGIDMGLADQSVLNNLKNENPRLYGNIHKKINYITKIFNASHRFYGKRTIKSLEDLEGKKVSCLKKGSTAASVCIDLFRMLNINAEIVYNSGGVAHRKIIDGKIAAAIDGAPAFNKFRPEEGDLHFIPISAATLRNRSFDTIRKSYLPARLTHKEHPNWIPKGQEIPTIASGSLLIVYAWPKNTERYNRLKKFIDLFFSNIDKFRKPPRHPRWASINLAADVAGWTRFPAAQEWLDEKKKQQMINNNHNEENNFPNEQANKIFESFLQWQKEKQ